MQLQSARTAPYLFLAPFVVSFLCGFLRLTLPPRDGLLRQQLRRRQHGGEEVLGLPAAEREGESRGGRSPSGVQELMASSMVYCLLPARKSHSLRSRDKIDELREYEPCLSHHA